MITLKDKDTDTIIGTIDEQQLQFLIDQLEEETSDDQDYYINEGTLEMFQQNGIDQKLFEMLKNALGSRDDMEIEWISE
jgi:hypothetical protein